MILRSLFGGLVVETTLSLSAPEPRDLPNACTVVIS